MKRLSKGFFILLVFAFILTALPVPKTIEFLRPSWVALLIVFFCLQHPRFLSLWMIFLIGILLDALVGSLFGQHALALIIVAALTLQFYRRVNVFPLPQKMITVFLLIGVYQLMLLWVDGVVGNAQGVELRWWAAFTSALVWPLIRWVASRRKLYA